MKSTSSFLLFPVLCLAHLPLMAQVTVVPPPVPAPGGAVVEVRPAGRVLDAAEARRQLSLSPQVVVVPQPGTVTTKTTTIVETEGKPRRVYNAERNVVVVQEQGQSRELPYVTLPVLFVKETDELLDQESRTALEQIAGIILVISKTEANPLFDIEGHTSTDGTDQFNLDLSAARAKRIYDELTQRYGVPPGVLSAHGYGETFPMFPNGTEEQMQLDRRVLVVRAK